MQVRGRVPHQLRPSMGQIITTLTNSHPISSMIRPLFQLHVGLIALCFHACCFATPAFAQTLEEELKRISPQELANSAMREGDAIRGAIVFFQPSMACARCHSVGDGIQIGLGPNLANTREPLSNEGIVEAVLEPSKSIRKGFETASVLTTDGESLTGLLVERTDDKVVLRDGNNQLITILKKDVESFVSQTQSMMPAGQINQLASRQQFLDLIRYLIEIRDGGVSRAKELQPAESLLALQLPEYEERIDHAGFVRDWNADSLARGEKIYQRVCGNCHGTKEQAGSLPTALRFAEGKFKNGVDPLSMYRTLTRGFGFMPAQTWMVPSQKYDVIHYIRETFLRPHNPSQLTTTDSSYLASLPKGDTRGPEPSKIEAWSAMDYGPSLTHCYETPGGSLNIAYKGTAVRLDSGAGGVSRGDQWMVFDTDTLRVSAAWHAKEDGKGSRFIDWRDIQLNGEHQVHPRVSGEVVLANGNGPGWADPSSGSFVDDQRVEGRDKRRYGPLPRAWGKFRGLYHHGSKVVFSYTVGNTEVLESPSAVSNANSKLPTTFLRTFNVGPRDRELVLQLDETPEGGFVEVVGNKESPIAIATENVRAGLLPIEQTVTWANADGKLRVRIAAGSQPIQFAIWMTSKTGDSLSLDKQAKLVASEMAGVSFDLKRLTQGGPARWPQILETKVATTFDKGPFAVDTLTAPESNPWLAQMRFSGLDFFADGSMAICTWDGDVWHVRMDGEPDNLKWQRIASGLYQPLGLKVIREKIHVTCRDQLAVLHDLNGDGEIDFYQCLNNDHQVTEHFHEFAMGLQVDEAGNFYYAKSGRHALVAVVPQHGTLLRVTPDGSRTDIIATGFRAANGVCLNPDGSFVVTDQEGFWNPKNRINWVTLNANGKPNFYGNMFGYHDVTDESDSAMEPPLCWITNAFDRSPAELLWVDSPKWKSLHGSLLNLSYGYGKVFSVLHEQVGGVRQGGMIELPIPLFPTGVMRGRFRPQDQQLYLCGMFAWAGNATRPGGLYRLRATGERVVLPVGLQAKKSGLVLTFAEPLDPSSIDPKSIAIKSWSLKRTKKYGSDHFNEKKLEVTATNLSADRKSLVMVVDELAPTWCMEIKFAFRTETGLPTEGVIHNTIHGLGD